MAHWNGKHKALTFSFDDGVTQDIRFIELMNKYGLKATFNINSSFFGLPGKLIRNGHEVTHNKISVTDAPAVYAGHEVAVHTLTHPLLTELDDDTVVYQVERDRLALSEIFGYEIVGMAYPCGGQNNDDRVAAAIRERTGVKYARTIHSSYSFRPTENLYRFDPTVYYVETDKMFSLAEQFLALDTAEDSVFYVWGHSYEMDAQYLSWERFEEFCRLVSGREDIFYCTNREALLGMPAPRA